MFNIYIIYSYVYLCLFHLLVSHDFHSPPEHYAPRGATRSVVRLGAPGSFRLSLGDGYRSSEVPI